ncbi:MAG: N-acetylmuramoyl-L-alanine amidase [Flavobacteriia bacterium]|nr:N-acetylmuramoyl-L-alanine amidase [Flavobacteriia bacterium]
MKFKSLCALLTIFILTSCASRQPKIIKKIIRDTVVINKITDKYESVRMANLDKYKISSSHYPAVGQDERVRFLVLHYTALDNDRSLNVLTSQQVSAHYLVPNDFTDSIYILVDETKRSWHAGQSYWKGINNINFSSIGIEIVNDGYYEGEITESNPTGWYFYGYPNMQIKKVAALAKNIIDRYKIDPVNVLAHSDVAPQRKQDPGPKFPWKQLYQDYGIGAWYEDAHKNIYLPKFPYDQIEDFEFIQTVQSDLNKYGYEIQKTGVWDDQTKKVIMAFQYHFRPERCDGVLDAETWAILQSLILKYRN